MQFLQDGTSIDSLRANGWYRVLRAPDNPLPRPQDNADVLVYVKQLWGSVIYQKIISLWGARQTLERTLIGDSWDILKDDLYATKAEMSVQIITSGDIYNLPSGRYYCTKEVLNVPDSQLYFYVEVSKWYDGAETFIKAYTLGLKEQQRLYTTFYSGGKWNGWQKYIVANDLEI